MVLVVVESKNKKIANALRKHRFFSNDVLKTMFWFYCDESEENSVGADLTRILIGLGLKTCDFKVLCLKAEGFGSVQRSFVV